MSVEQNVEVMKQWFQEVWNEQKTDIVHKKLAKDAVGFGQGEHGKPVKGPDEYVKWVGRIHGSFSKMELTVDDIFGCDDKVVARWSATMKHTGDAIGIPPTGRTVHIWGIAIAVFRDGMIVGGFDAWDQAALLEQIGVFDRGKAAFVA